MIICTLVLRWKCKNVKHEFGLPDLGVRRLFSQPGYHNFILKSNCSCSGPQNDRIQYATKRRKDRNALQGPLTEQHLQLKHFELFWRHLTGWTDPRPPVGAACFFYSIPVYLRSFYVMKYCPKILSTRPPQLLLYCKLRLTTFIKRILIDWLIAKQQKVA